MRGHTYHVYLKDDPKAIANFTKVIELEPNKAFNYRIRSQVYMDAKVHDKAIADSTKAIELEPTANNYLHRGQIHNRFNQYDQAIADSTKAIELDPKKNMLTAAVTRHTSVSKSSTRQSPIAPKPLNSIPNLQVVT